MRFIFNEETSMLEKYEPYKEVCISCDNEEDYNKLMAYLKKFTPKKPEYCGSLKCCPTCGSLADTEKYYDFCPFCGQRLDWSNENG